MAGLLVENNLALPNRCFVMIAEDDSSDLVYGSSNAMVALTDDGWSLVGRARYQWQTESEVCREATWRVHRLHSTAEAKWISTR